MAADGRDAWDANRSAVGQRLEEKPQGGARPAQGAGTQAGIGRGRSAVDAQTALAGPADSATTSRPGPAVTGEGIPIPAAYSALNKGGGIGIPMGAAPAGHGQEGTKSKRVPHDGEALYTEDRAWTEGVIGPRRAS